jgi:hypothetical protein
MFSPSQPSPPSPPNILSECLKLKILTNNRLMKFLYDKMLNVDLKSVFLEKQTDKVFVISFVTFTH